jgi:hypothetical protein
MNHSVLNVKKVRLFLKHDGVNLKILQIVSLHINGLEMMILESVHCLENVYEFRLEQWCKNMKI